MSIDKSAEEITRARRAEEIANDPMFREAVEVVRARIMQDWADSPAHDTQGRERLWQANALLGKLVEHLAGVMTTGAMARMELETRSRMQRAAQAMRSLW